MATRVEKSWPCKVELRDGRCPDGCCGACMAVVTSPTGRTVTLDYRAIPAPSRERIIEGVLQGGKVKELECRVQLNGTVTLPLSLSDLQVILANEGARYS